MGDLITGYAKGIFEMARAEGELERVEDELFVFAEALDASSELRSKLTDPQLPLDRKQGIIDDLLGARACSLTVGLIQLMVSQGRAADLSAVAQAVAETVAGSRDKAVAEIRSAVPLDDETVRRLETGLSRATGTDVEARVIVDKSIIGGIRARVGDTVIDGSLARRFDSFRRAVSGR